MVEKKIKTQKTINGKAVPLTKSKSKKKEGFRISSLYLY